MRSLSLNLFDFTANLRKEGSLIQKVILPKPIVLDQGDRPYIPFQVGCPDRPDKLTEGRTQVVALPAVPSSQIRDGPCRAPRWLHGSLDGGDLKAA